MRLVCNLIRCFSLIAIVFASPFAFAEAENADAQNSSIPSSLAQQKLITDGVNLDGRLIVVGERGHILFSDDHGKHWQQAKVPTRVLLTAVVFPTPDTGFAVGHDAVILRSKDRGKNWEKVYSDPVFEAPLLDIDFINSSDGIAVGAYGLLLFTRDGGENWEQTSISEEDMHFNSIIKLPEQGGLMLIGEAGSIYRLPKAGADWEVMDSPYDGSYFGGLMLNNQSLLIYGLRGHIFRSDDLGLSWYELNTPSTVLLSDGLVLGQETVLLGGMSGTVLVSRDKGHTFHVELQGDRGGIVALLAANNKDVFRLGDFGIKKLKLR